MPDDPKSTPGPAVSAVVDVDAIVEDIRRRAGSGVSSTSTPRERVRGAVVLRPELAYSSKLAVGPAITVIKRLLMRLHWTVWSDLVAQVNDELESLRATATTEVRRREALETRIGELERQIEELGTGRR